MTGTLTSRPWLLALVAAVVAVAAIVMQEPARTEAHPLGNFTVSRYSRIEVYSDIIRVHYVVDMAEIPTFQANDSVDTDGDGGISESEAETYASSSAKTLAERLNLTLNGQPAALQLVAQGVVFPEGQGGLDTSRLTVILEAPTRDGLTALAYTDDNFADRLGWKEVVIPAVTGLQVTGDVSSEDVSQALTAYPDDLLRSPLDVSSVSFDFEASAAIAAPALDTSALSLVPAEAVSRAGGGFASLIDSENLTLTVVIFALLAAFAFGAVHALEPGHGKTMVAAYFVGVKGGARQALTLGAIIAVTHSIGVLAIGAVTLFGSQYILPERLYPWLTLVSGLMILLLGLRLIASRGGLRWMHGVLHRILPHHHHAHEHAEVSPSGPPPWRTLILLGLADGMTPSPSALVVLLAAVSLDRVGLGIALIVAFSVGLAAVLTGVSLALVYAGQAADWCSRRLPFTGGVATRISGAMSGEGVVMRVAPVAGAMALLAVGLFLTARALSDPSISLL